MIVLFGRESFDGAHVICALLKTKATYTTQIYYNRSIRHTSLQRAVIITS